MANLHDDSWRGTLTADRLQRYLTVSDIDSVGGPGKVTPLAAACWKGHLDVVTVLLDNPHKLADPNARSPHDRTALYYATTRSPPADRAAIVRLLLKAGADPDACSADDGMNTPLMNAITEVKDKDVVRELLDRGASLTKENDEGETAEMLAKGTPLESMLGGKDKLGSTLAAIIDLVVSAVMVIIVYTNSTQLQGAVETIANKLHEVAGTKEPDSKAAVSEPQDAPKSNKPKTLNDNTNDDTDAPKSKKPKTLNNKTNDDTDATPQIPKGQSTNDGIVANLYGISGTKQPLPVPDIVKEISMPKTPQEFVASLDKFVEESGLEKFFAPGDRFLQTLAEKAAALRNDPTTSLGSPENIKRLTRLSLYQPVIYCDDSGSMGIDNRYQNQSEMVKRIARIATRIVPDNYGVELRFINARSASNLNASQIEDAMRRVSPTGGTNLGTGLRTRILHPLVYDVITNKRPFERPLLVCVITDGNPDPEAPTTFKDAIVECRRKLVNAGYDPTAVMFSISQIGDDAKARDFLRALQREREIEDVLYCTADRLDEEFKELRANERRLDEWLLKVLTAPIMGRDEV